MGKVDQDFVKQSFEGAINNYKQATENVGLWESEEFMFNKYFKRDKPILDVGCGTGRTTFGLYRRGYTNLVGVDLTPRMIETANQISKKEGLNIEFKQGDATDLEFADGSFVYALFSFNGLMQIPKRANRVKAMAEINRVLKPGGIFIFTTHDRDANEDFLEFWQEEKKRWKAGEQDPRLYDFGDRIADSKNENRDIFIHIPDREEILSCLEEAGFQHVEDFYRDDKFEESKEVKEITGECRFWVARKEEITNE